MPAHVAGEEYVRIVGHTPERYVFQQLALALATPGSNIFDFGSGPGLDAEIYARNGHTVHAYDVDPEMREYFSQHCGELIKEDRIAQHSGTYEEFLGASDSGWADLITSDYAPLSLVADLPPLFKRLHQLSRGRARVLASVLNPLSIRDFRSRLWWRHLGPLIRRGEYYLETEPTRTCRRTPARIAELAAPLFRLVGAMPLTPKALSRIALSNAGFADARRSALIFSLYTLILLERVE